MHWIIRQLTLLLALCVLRTIAVAQTPIVLGERLSLVSQRLGETRSIDIYLPPSYHDPSLQPQVYPVVYLLDAGADFRYFTTLMEKLAQGIPSVPEFIVVGIEKNQHYTIIANANALHSDCTAQLLIQHLGPGKTIRMLHMKVEHFVSLANSSNEDWKSSNLSVALNYRTHSDSHRDTASSGSG